jgi:hypothetical protein
MQGGLLGAAGAQHAVLSVSTALTRADLDKALDSLRIPDAFRDPVTGGVTARAMLDMRLRSGGFGPGGMRFAHDPRDQPYRIVSVEQLNDRFAVFMVHNNQPLILEDELEFFPSDKLIAKIKLLQVST